MADTRGMSEGMASIQQSIANLSKMMNQMLKIQEEKKAMLAHTTEILEQIQSSVDELLPASARAGEQSVLDPDNRPLLATPPGFASHVLSDQPLHIHKPELIVAASCEEVEKSELVVDEYPKEDHDSLEVNTIADQSVVGDSAPTQVAFNHLSSEVSLDFVLNKFEVDEWKETQGFAESVYAPSCYISKCSPTVCENASVYLPSFSLAHETFNGNWCSIQLFYMAAVCPNPPWEPPDDRTRRELKLMSLPMSENDGIENISRVGKGKEAMSLLAKMQMSGVSPDVIIYNSLIYGFSVNGKWEEARAAFVDMEKNDVSFIHGLCNAGKLDEAKGIFCKMKGSGIIPHVMTYCSMISGLCDAGSWKEAETKKGVAIILESMLKIDTLDDYVAELEEEYKTWMIEAIDEDDDFVRISYLKGVELDELIGKVTIAISFVPALGGYAFKDGYLPSALDLSLMKEMSSILHSEILVQRASSLDEFTRLTAITWIHERVKLGGDQLVRYYANILVAVLPCISDSEEKIRVVARETNEELRGIKADTSEGFDVSAMLSIARRQLSSKWDGTRVEALLWLLVLLNRYRIEVLCFLNDIFDALLGALSDPSNEVVLLVIEVLACIAEDQQHFQHLVVSLLQMFQYDNSLLEKRGFLIIRRLCVLLNAEKGFRQLSSIVQSETDLEFASLMVQALNLILLTSSELSGLRCLLKESLVTPSGKDLFVLLYASWCHSPVSLISLCVLAQTYQHASMVIQSLVEEDINVKFLVQLDKLINLLETPVFAYLRLQLLEPARCKWLLKALYGLLMLLPQQSAAFKILKTQPKAVPSFSFSSEYYSYPSVQIGTIILEDGDVLVFPDMVGYRGLKESDVEGFVEDVIVRGEPWGAGNKEEVTSTYVFVCAQGSRDKRCGVCGPVLLEKLKEEIEARGLSEQVVTSPCHIGGHKYAGNLIIYGTDPTGNVTVWYGYVTPDDVAELLDTHIGKGEIIEKLWRGFEVIALDASGMQIQLYQMKEIGRKQKNDEKEAIEGASCCSSFFPTCDFEDHITVKLLSVKRHLELRAIIFVTVETHFDLFDTEKKEYELFDMVDMRDDPKSFGKLDYTMQTMEELLEEAVAVSTISVRISKFLIFSSPRPPEDADLEDKVNFKEGGMLRTQISQSLGSLMQYVEVLTFGYK